MKWKIKYDVIERSWTVTDGKRAFKCSNEGDAVWLSNLLNGYPT